MKVSWTRKSSGPLKQSYSTRPRWSKGDERPASNHNARPYKVVWRRCRRSQPKSLRTGKQHHRISWPKWSRQEHDDQDAPWHDPAQPRRRNRARKANCRRRRKPPTAAQSSLCRRRQAPLWLHDRATDLAFRQFVLFRLARRRGKKAPSRIQTSAPAEDQSALQGNAHQARAAFGFRAVSRASDLG